MRNKPEFVSGGGGRNHARACMREVHEESAGKFGMEIRCWQESPKRWDKCAGEAASFGAAMDWPAPHRTEMDGVKLRSG